MTIIPRERRASFPLTKLAALRVGPGLSLYDQVADPRAGPELVLLNQIGTYSSSNKVKVFYI